MIRPACAPARSLPARAGSWECSAPCWAEGICAGSPCLLLWATASREKGPGLVPLPSESSCLPWGRLCCCVPAGTWPSVS